MKRSIRTFGLLLVLTLVARAATPVWISFYESELQRAKRAAVVAMNSPEVWKRFPKEQHEPHYTPIMRNIAFGFTTKQGGESLLTVIIPTTHIGPRHRALVHVTFDQGLNIIRIAEVPQI